MATAAPPPLPATQVVVVADTIGGPEVLRYCEEHPVPVPGEGQVLVKNVFSGVNYVDTYFRNGFYQSQKPEILGREGVGEIVAVGPPSGGGGAASGLRIGDKVAWLGTGGYAQYTVTSVTKTVRISEGIALQDVASSFLGGLTVLSMLDEAFPVKQGDWVLLHAAAGSVGVIMVQFLKLRGAKLIATAGGPSKVAVVRALGADHVVDYRGAEGAQWPDVVRHLTNDRGVDVVFDSVGKDTWEGSLAVVRRKGTVVWFGNASGPVPPMSLQ